MSKISNLVKKLEETLAKGKQKKASEGEVDVTIKVEIRVMRPGTKECQKLQEKLKSLWWSLQKDSTLLTRLL